MRKTFKLVTFLCLSILVSCGGKENKKAASFTAKKNESVPEQVVPKAKEVASKRINLTDKGIGPITTIKLDPKIDQKMVKKGKEIYDKMCTACHNPETKLVGPAQAGIMTRRSPEWIMNMILNPEEMVQKDPLAKDLMAEFNGIPMSNLNLSKEDARAVLEYFRTL